MNTDAGRTNERTNDKRRTREDRATQPMDAGWLSFAKRPAQIVKHHHLCCHCREERVFLSGGY